MKPSVSVILSLFVEEEDGTTMKGDSWSIGHNDPKNMAELLIDITRAVISQHSFLSAEEMRNQVYLFERFVSSIEIRDRANDGD